MKSHHLLPILSAVLLCCPLPALQAEDELSAATRASEFSLGKNGLALEGYDPVSYLAGSPVKGDESIVLEYRGVTYHFESEDNREAFYANPEKYEPQYGGWCAWAMYDGGGRTESNPESYTIVDGKLYVFYDGFFGDTLKKWKDRAEEETEAAMIETADRHWESQVGPDGAD